MASYQHDSAMSSQRNSNANLNSGNGIKAADIAHLLRDRVAMLTGGRDRNGRTIIFCPQRDSAEGTSIDNLHMVFTYLHAIPSDEVKERGFVVIVDMRGKMTWAGVKPVLKTLNEHFPGTVHAVYVIKPDKFWEKQKANLQSAKYKFEVQMISIESLLKLIDPGQLTTHIGGRLFYDHDEWLELRIAIEDIVWRAVDVLRTFESIRNELENGQLPIDVDTARTALDSHTQLRKRIGRAPVEAIETDGQKVE